MRGKISIPGLTVMLAISTAIMLLPTTRASAQTEKVLFSFNGQNGNQPLAGLVTDATGNLYGTTLYGGDSENCNNFYLNFTCGMVFELSRKPGGAWAEKVLHSFNFKDGEYPESGLIIDTLGNLYGITTGIAHAAGAAFELSPASGGDWAEAVLHSFSFKYGRVDGVSPLAGLTFDAAGNLYGTTTMGGEGSCIEDYSWIGCGTVFELVRAEDGSWSANALYSFTEQYGSSGYYPGSLVFDASGNLYGVALGGIYNNGVVFELTPAADGSWTETIVHSFGSGEDGRNPTGLVFDTVGNLYGTTASGGAENNGIAFELSPSTGGNWLETVLYTFDNEDGSPEGTLVFDTSGNLYGETYSGGAQNVGTVFELTPKSGGGWTKNVLHEFSDNGKDGFVPVNGKLVLDAAGNLYGTTSAGGAYNHGTVFEIAH